MPKQTSVAKPPVTSEHFATSQGAAAPHHAYLLSVELQNVRCFGESQILKFTNMAGAPAQWTIILGLNGTGKTTILQSIVGFEMTPTIFRGEKDLRFISLSPRGEILTNLRRGEERQAQIVANLTLADRLPVDSINLVKAGIALDYDSVGFSGCSYDSPPDDSFWCCGYGAGRRLGSIALGDSSSNDATATLFSDKAELRNPEEWLLTLDYATAKEPSGQTQQKARLEEIKDLLIHILPGVDNIRFTTQNGFFPRPRVEFKTPYGWVPLKQLGYGYQTLITWVTDLVSRMVERYHYSPNPLAEPAVVLVDEIDLHLHPQWQRKLMGFLTERFPNTQFIATAHSPLMAQAAADANLVVLRREGDHVVIDNDVDSIKNWRIDQILTSDLFGLESARPPHLDKLLEERKQLLTSPKLSAAKKKRLKELEAEIGDLPTGESAQAVKENEAIRRALKLLQEEKGR